MYQYLIHKIEVLLYFYKHQITIRVRVVNSTILKIQYPAETLNKITSVTVFRHIQKISYYQYFSKHKIKISLFNQLINTQKDQLLIVKTMKKQIILQTTQYSLLKMEFTSLQLVNSITKKTT